MTATLNSLIMAGVISWTSTPRAMESAILQVASLVHGGGGNHAALVGKRLHASHFARG